MRTSFFFYNNYKTNSSALIKSLSHRCFNLELILLRLLNDKVLILFDREKFIYFMQVLNFFRLFK
jgi:hypothetical protein